MILDIPTLFDPVAVGDLRLRNRIFMAPLTRNRSSGAGRAPNALMRDYYVQRASAGMIVTEATSVEPMGVGYPHTPGIWSEEHVDGWRAIATACTRPAARSCFNCGTWDASPTPAATAGRSLWRRARSRRKGTSACCVPSVPTSSRGRSRPKRQPGRRGLPQRRRERQSRGLRRGRDSWRERLLSRPVPAGRRQQAHGPLRRRNRKPGALHARSDGRGRLGVGRGPRRHASRPPGADAHDMGDSNLLATFVHVARELGKRKIAFLCARESLTGPRTRAGAEICVRRRIPRQRGLHARDRDGDSRRGRSRRRRFRQALHRQSRPAAPHRAERPPQPMELGDLLLRGRGRLHRLPRARRGGGVDHVR